jgi:hypothetical protein
MFKSNTVMARFVSQSTKYTGIVINYIIDTMYLLQNMTG